MSTRPETIYILEEQRQTFPPPSSPLHQPQPNPSLYEKCSYQTYGNIKYQPQYHRMFGESVFLVKCCGFNWQLSHSHANNQPYTLQRNFAQTQPVTAPLESYFACLKNFAAELFIKIVLSITSLNRAVQCRGDYLKFPNI